ncbi:unnamed protein product [Cladocopium goreaui]|uniref:Uncharacterized protein n=1 Tax=Cladocopium goreaui TaxID=2562237 RepID=A0A9P1GAT9_9DINO|nr:unnamed protein product [Cladocopium goreaui]
MKRPASAGASSSWKDGLASASSPPRDLGADLGGEEPEEEAVLEFDPEIEVAAAGNQGQAQLRDRVKMQKFLGMLSANQLPKFLQKAWEESQTKKHGKRERQTLIVNSLFARSEQGRLVMDLEKPIFKAMESNYVETSSKATSKSLPKLCVVQTDDGEQYSWRQNSQTVKRGEKSEMGWEAKREGESKDMAKYKAAAQSGQDLPLTPDRWEVVKKQIGQASGALDRMETEALRHLNSLTDPDDDLYDVSKDVVQQIRKLKNLMSHVLTFKQMENGEKITMDGYNRLVFECGCTVEKLDEKLAGVKGQLSKRAKRSA